MDDALLFEVLQRLQNLNCKPPNERQGHAHEVVILDELEQVDWEQFERNDQVLPKKQMVFKANNVVLIIRIMLFQVL